MALENKRLKIDVPIELEVCGVASDPASGVTTTVLAVVGVRPTMRFEIRLNDEVFNDDAQRELAIQRFSGTALARDLRDFAGVGMGLIDALDDFEPRDFLAALDACTDPHTDAEARVAAKDRVLELIAGAAIRLAQRADLQGV